MREEKLYKVVIVIIILTFAFAGCGKQRKEADKIILKYTTYSDVTSNKFRQDKGKEFEKLYPGVVTKFEPIYAPEYSGKLLTQIAGGTAPDVFFAWDYFYLVRTNSLLDLTPYIERDKEFYDDIYPVLMEYHKYKGKIYGIPGNLNTNVIFYNKSLFDTDGLNYPDTSWTWDTMLEGAKRLTKRESKGRTLQFGIAEPETLWVWYILQNGGKIWDKNKNRCVINSPEAAEAVNFVKDLSEKYYVTPKAGDMIGESGRSNQEMFIMGKIGMYIGGRFWTTYFKKIKNLEWRIAPLSKGKKRVGQLSFNTLAVSATTKHPELAYKLIRFLITPEAIRFLVDVGDSIPIFSSEKTNDYFLSEPGRPEGENRVYLEAMRYAYTLNEVMHPEISFMEARSVMGGEFELFLIGKRTSEEMLYFLEQKFNEMLKGTEQSK